MISSDTHIIRQQIVDIAYSGTTTDGLALQQKITSLCTDEIFPALEKMLTRYAHLKGHVYIDLLEIDLGTFQSDELEYKLAEIFKEKLEFLLSEAALQNFLASNENEVPAADNRFRFTDEVTSFGEALIHFMQTGRLPWTYQLPAGKTLYEVLGEILQGQARDVVLNNLKESLHHPMVVRRMVLQFHESIVLKILNYISPPTARHAEKLLTVFTSPEHLPFREKILEAACAGLTDGNTSPSEGGIFALAFGLFQSDSKVSPQLEMDAILRIANKHQVDTKPTVVAKAHAIQDRSIVPQSSHSIIPDDTPGLYVNNAGLILLHPFLPALFEGTGISVEHKIMDPSRALFLLHYLCTGRKEAPEYDLTFSKIICGIPVDEPVPSNVILPDQDIEEADALIAATIRHWSILQNTSHDGLRGTFLLRRGKLTTAFDGGWLLQVERQSVDILMDGLPWGISMVKFPWLPQLIHVEW